MKGGEPKYLSVFDLPDKKICDNCGPLSIDKFYIRYKTNNNGIRYVCDVRCKHCHQLQKKEIRNRDVEKARYNQRKYDKKYKKENRLSNLMFNHFKYLWSRDNDPEFRKKRNEIKKAYRKRLKNKL